MSECKCGAGHKTLSWICLILLVIGGLNWGLVGLFHFNLVTFIFGDMTLLSRLIYIVVGAAAIIMILSIPCMVKCHKPKE